MSDQTTEQKRLEAAVKKMNDGLQEYLDVVADEGEPEAPMGAVMLFESRGFGQDGNVFNRISYVFVEAGAGTSMLGMIDIAGAKVAHDLRRHLLEDEAG